MFLLFSCPSFSCNCIFTISSCSASNLRAMPPLLTALGQTSAHPTVANTSRSAINLGSLAGEFLCYDSWHIDLAIIQSLCHEPRYTCSLCEHTSFIFVIVCLLTLSPPPFAPTTASPQSGIILEV